MGFFDFLKQKSVSPTFSLGHLIEILQDGICIANLNGDLIYLNRAGYNLLRIDTEEEIAQYNFFRDFIIDEAINIKIKDIIHQEGLVNNFELKLHTNNGTSIDVLLTVNLIGDYRQQTIGFLFLFKDITELKKIQQQLWQSQKLESIGLMASGIAHDFNNILAAIIPNAELIKMTVPKDSENYHRAEIIEKSAIRASGIAHKLLTFTRDQEQQKQIVNLNEIVKESIELIQNSIPKIVKVQLKLEEKLYPILADPTQVQQIIMNLVLNARDAMPKGGQITIATENIYLEDGLHHNSLKEGYYVKLSVEDNGTGIPAELMNKIFDPFFTTKEIGKGTGLGLSMVYGIVKSHNGSIDVQSQEGVGTRFDILFPADEKSIPEKVKEQDEMKLPKGMTFLVVDDEEYVRNILGDILTFLGMQVLKAENGKEAVEIYSDNKEGIDYVILDLRMPKMDGRATFAALKKINPDVKVIITSGFDDKYEASYLKEGVLGFLKKPYTLNNISKTLKSLINQ